MKITSAIADDIKRISEHTRELFKSGLTERAYIILIAAHTRVPQGQIEKVLRALPKLEDVYLKKESK